MKNNEIEDVTAWNMGYVACADDLSIKANPFKSNDSNDYKEWINGWNHYDAEYNPDYYTHQNAIRQGWI